MVGGIVHGLWKAAAKCWPLLKEASWEREYCRYFAAIAFLSLVLDFWTTFLWQRDRQRSWKSCVMEMINRYTNEWADRVSKEINSNQDRNDVLPFIDAKIFTVSEHLREVCRESYAPLILPIGPYHRNLETDEMEQYKIFGARQITASSFEQLQTYVHEKIEVVKKMYDKRLHIDSRPLSLMLALDACFLMNLLLEYKEHIYQTPVTAFPQYALPRRHFWDVLRDLMLVENQIPLRLVKQAFEYTGLLKVGGVDLLQESVHTMIAAIYPFKSTAQLGNIAARDFRLENVTVQNCHHLLDYLYKACTLKDRDDPKSERSDVKIPCATELVAAGISLVAIGGNLNGIRFDMKTACLYLPKIKIYSQTESWFRNLLAYEQCLNQQKVDWCSYMRLMDYLVESPEDVVLLCKSGIIINFIGSNAAVTVMWNTIGKNVELFLTQRDVKVLTSVNRHLASKRKVWWAEMKHLYFSRPWSVVSVIAAVILLIMTAVQTLFTVWPYA